MGILKRGARYLLAGNRLPTEYWGVAVLAAAHLERADVGLGKYPQLPYGTRGMLVTSKARTDVQPEALSQEDLTWVILNLKNWDPPDRPLEAPLATDFDGGAVSLSRDLPAATRETATCEACLQTRRGSQQTHPHSLVWGECLRAENPTPTGQ